MGTGVAPPPTHPNGVNGQQSTVNRTSRAFGYQLAGIGLLHGGTLAENCPMHPHHRSLHAWIEGREVSRLAIRASKLYWSPAGSAVFGQLQRSALSVQLNIAEGFALADIGRFGNHLAIAYGSAVETGEILELAGEEELLPTEFANDALGHCRRA